MPIVIALLAAGAVALAIAGVLQRAKARDIIATETSTAGVLLTEATDVAKEIGAGAFSRQVELKGQVESASPLTSEIGGEACVYYKSVVSREYEERYEERDSEGRYHTRTRRGSEEVSHNERMAPFMLRDESGAVEVDPSGAKIEAVKSLSRFEQGSQPAAGLGSLLLNIAAEGLGGRRTLGYRLEEWTIPVGQRLYALGEVSDSDGKLRLHKPREKGKRYYLSVRSEEELVKSARTTFLVTTIIGAVLGVGALALLVLLLLGVV